jgi:hypothetical protein
MDGRFNLVKLSKRNGPNPRPVPARTRFEEILRIVVLEAQDHLPSLYNASRYM